MNIFFSSFRFKVGSGSGSGSAFFSQPEPDPWKKKCRILIPGKKNTAGWGTQHPRTWRIGLRARLVITNTVQLISPLNLFGNFLEQTPAPNLNTCYKCTFGKIGQFWSYNILYLFESLFIMEGFTLSPSQTEPQKQLR